MGRIMGCEDTGGTAHILKLDCPQWDAVLYSMSLKVVSEGSACWGWMIRFYINLEGVHSLGFSTVS